MGQIQLRITLRKKGLAQTLERLQAVPQQSEDLLERIALESLGRLVQATPIRYYGNVRKAWVHRRIGDMHHVLANPSKVMKWLEKGTKAHGPVTAKALFIPLNQATSEKGPREVMEANAQARATCNWRNYNRAASATRKLNSRYVPNYPYKIGVDFVFAKWVKGIKAHWIARDEQKRVKKDIRSGLSSLIRKALKG